jgi:hypothetical protein
MPLAATRFATRRALWIVAVGYHYTAVAGRGSLAKKTEGYAYPDGQPVAVRPLPTLVPPYGSWQYNT